MKVGFISLGRSTFDVPFAQETHKKALAYLRKSYNLVGLDQICFDEKDFDIASKTLQNQSVACIVVIQSTFADSSLASKLAQNTNCPLLFWCFSEPRSGQRLRLNSFCGINLAAHSIKRNVPNCVLDYAYDFDEMSLKNIHDFIKAAVALESLKGKTLGILGEHPEGFEACDYEAHALKTFGLSIKAHPLLDFIEQIKVTKDCEVTYVHERAKSVMDNLQIMDQAALFKSCKIYDGLSKLCKNNGYIGLGVRCWPEFFTHFGGAACGAKAFLNEDGIPTGCEADIYGVITNLVLQKIANESAFNTDLVDANFEDDTCVYWHCGQAPKNMAKGSIKATIHSNRKLPLLYEFALKPGVITVARFTKSKGQLRLFLAKGEMLDRPLAFGGTSGVAYIEAGARNLIDLIMKEGLEHHSSIVYGDHINALKKIAQFLNIQTVTACKRAPYA